MKHQLGRLQRVQNTAARIISGKKRRDHITVTPVLRELHWLPVEERVCYKILMQTFKCMNGLAPSYLSNMLNLYSPARALRSADSNILKQPKARTKWELHTFFLVVTQINIEKNKSLKKILLRCK
jgi:hypothetical protein